MNPKPTFLAIDTSTEACSAAILHANGCVWRDEMTPKAHTTLLIPMIEALLAETGLKLADMAAIAVTRGPGSFTGVRIGVGIAQGIGFGLNKPVYEISSLEALAAHTAFPGRVIAAIDARMQEVYTATYCRQHNVISVEGCEVLCSPATLMGHALQYADESAVLLAGTGWGAYEPTFPLPAGWQIKPNQYPHAKAVAELAYQQWLQGKKGVGADSLQPVYLRDNVAEKSKKVKLLHIDK
ncbi:tRNA (adenosine(37)-N6)-threonylcarbamoyltransferase complex dimerization subunit type 1 TsaB [Candidatus Berkiella aquae]|uniref:tRNA threonylcarbamoyladenosine biosynthesis protein TsaB n=1 Tax=Candidatus Berkiella aquae TaxID=295108 RepID=A0A0Q9YU28_9GAMM|nr:tRNA (adenosine(37)-N6)-threonylcarbamoyltransferase complex dimerization subunit type 1 TsaB [Candidatus Berkiella aquae]MCS5711115.1 tRNA (adenosine(37)-N6)-threonylcarbamoyltransferase complex dimerization subunit type 1 TsaB [Candidatus Berkiella aquae]